MPKVESIRMLRPTRKKKSQRQSEVNLNKLSGTNDTFGDQSFGHEQILVAKMQSSSDPNFLFEPKLEDGSKKDINRPLNFDKKKQPERM